MTEVLEEVSLTGDAPETKLGVLIGKGEDELVESRRSLRKRLPRLSSSRGLMLKTSPKSPLMRMAEMRKGGLRGRALRHSGRKDVDEPDSKAGKGKKRFGGRGSRMLMAIPEDLDFGEGSLGGLGGSLEGGSSEAGLGEVGGLVSVGEGVIISGDEGGERVLVSGAEGGEEAMEVVGVEGFDGNPGGLVAEMAEDRSSMGSQYKGSGEGCSYLVGQAETIPAGMNLDLDLDLVSAQPLQEMTFVGKQVPIASDVKVGEGFEGEENGEFPRLSRDILKSAREKKRNRGGGKEMPSMTDQQAKEKLFKNKDGMDSKANGSSWAGPRNYKESLADGVHSGGKLPVSFEPEKIRKIGVPGETCGLPSIQFSSAETSYLAEKLGFAIVGIFSHYIPSSLHIQRALMGMKFKGEFTWKYTNAKHILVQFASIEDYAKLLNGPNGMPVWFVDCRPMRVFKWTTDFDPFFESSIAAVWCNLIGLPFHLFEKSALFAIGGLLGEPLMVDHATISRSRLSFARLCIEIDISKTQVQEIILNMQRREIKQSVRWDRIPLYCQECKHVGHSSDVCYANGNREKPMKRNYKFAADEGLRQGNSGGMMGRGWIVWRLIWGRIF